MLRACMLHVHAHVHVHIHVHVHAHAHAHAPMLLHAVHPALGEASTTNLTLALTLTLSLTLTLYYSRLTWVGARPRERSSSFARDSAARRAVSSPSA